MPGAEHLFRVDIKTLKLFTSRLHARGKKSYARCFVLVIRHDMARGCFFRLVV